MLNLRVKDVDIGSDPGDPLDQRGDICARSFFAQCDAEGPTAGLAKVIAGVYGVLVNSERARAKIDMQGLSLIHI